MKRVTLVFDFEDGELEEFLESQDCAGQLHEWVFGELCQNYGFGTLVTLREESPNESD